MAGEGDSFRQQAPAESGGASYNWSAEGYGQRDRTARPPKWDPLAPSEPAAQTQPQAQPENPAYAIPQRPQNRATYGGAEGNGRVAPLALQATAPTDVRPDHWNKYDTNGHTQASNWLKDQQDAGRIPNNFDPNQLYRPEVPVQQPGVGNVTQVTDYMQDVVDNSLTAKFKAGAYPLGGALGGVLGSGPIPYWLDKATAGNQLQDRKVLGWLSNQWRNNYSPLVMEMKSLEDGLMTAQGKHAKEIAAHKGFVDAIDVLDKEIVTSRSTLEASRIAASKAGLPEKASAYRIAVAKIGDLDFGTTGKLQVGGQVKFGSITSSIIFDHEMPEPGAFLTLKEAEQLKLHQVMHNERDFRKLQVATAEQSIAAAEAAVGKVQKEMKFLDSPQGFGFDKSKFVSAKRVSPSSPVLGEPLGLKHMNARIAEDASNFERLTKGWRGHEWDRKIGEGILAASLGLAADYASDKLLTGNDQIGSEGHLFRALQGPAIAMAVMGPKNSFNKLMAGSAAATVGVAADYMFPSAGGQYSELLKPNPYEAVLMGAAWMLPAESFKARAAAVAIGWGLGKGMNGVNMALERSTGYQIPGIWNIDTAKRMNGSLEAAVAEDAQHLSHGSFVNMVSKGITLARENDMALGVQLTKFMEQHKQDENPLYALHAEAAMKTAGADVWLERGTKLDYSKWQGEGRMLAGTGLDIGGQALDLYRQASECLQYGQEIATQSGGADPKQFAESLAMVNERIDAIYGPHDLSQGFQRLKEAYRQNMGGQGDFLHFKVALNEQLVTMKTNDSRYFSKMARDVALLDLAMADTKADSTEGGGAAANYNEALNYLQHAMRADPNAPDNMSALAIAVRMSAPHATDQEIMQMGQILADPNAPEGMAAELLSQARDGKIPQAIINQYKSKINNPFSVPRQGY